MRWVGWILLSLSFQVAYLVRLSAGVLRDVLTAEFALSASSFGLMSSMVFYSYMAMQIPVGILADTKGVRSTVGWEMMVAALGAVLFAAGSSVPMLFLGRVLMGIGVAGVFVCTMRFLANQFEGGIFGTLSGITSFIGNAGAIVAQTPLALLVASTSWRTAFFIIGGLCFALAVSCFLILPKGERGAPFSFDALVEGIGDIMRNRGLYPVAVAYLGSSACPLALTGTWGVSWFSQVRGSEDGPLAVTVIAVGIMFGTMAAGRLSDRMKSRRKPLRLFSGLHALSWGAFTFFGATVPSSVLGVLLFCLGFFSGFLVIHWSMGKELNPPSRTGLAISVLNTFAFLGVALLTSLIGVLLDAGAGLPIAQAYRNAFLLPFGVAVAAFVAALEAPETYGRR
mgnify:FL=1